MANKLLDMSIVTPDKSVFEGEVQAAWLPGSKSPFEVLYNHAPIVSGLNVGEIKIRDGVGNMTSFATGKGFVEISNNKITVLTDTAEKII